MKKSILAASLACALGLSQAGHAYTIIIDGQEVTDANITDFSFNTATGELSLTNDPNANVKIGDASGESVEEEPVEEEPVEEEPEEEEPVEEEPSGDCSDTAANVTCSTHIGDLASAKLEGVAYTIPQGTVIASRFTPSAGGPTHGKFNFLRSFSDYNVWISTTPGGATLNGGPWDYNTKRCEFSPAKYTQSVPWTREEGGDWTKCSLTTGDTYYINVEFVDPERSSGSIDRTIKQ